MRPEEARLGYPFADEVPQPAQTIRVAEGLHWLRFPLPFSLDHVNVWLLEDRIDGVDGWTLVDTGAWLPDTTALWERIRAGFMATRPLLRVVCTHMHPDHCGQVAALGAPLWMTQSEYAMARVFLESTVDPLPATMNHFRVHGADRRFLDQLAAGHGPQYMKLVPSLPQSLVRMAAGDELNIGGRSWRVVIGRGHSPEHAGLVCDEDRLLIGGDMVLPRISPNCSVFDSQPLDDPLHHYLQSLKAYGPMDEDMVVLPSHGRVFTGLHERISQLQLHHDERLDLTLRVCSDAALSAGELVPHLFGRDFNPFDSGFAIGEAIAHLHALWYRGELDRGIDADGTIRFRGRGRT